MDIYINLNYRGTPFVFYTVHRVEIFFFGAHPLFLAMVLRP